MTIHRPDGSTVDIVVSDDSYRQATLMGDDILSLNFELVYYQEFQIGCSCVFEGRKYTLRQHAQIKKQNSRHFQYTLTLSTEAYILRQRMMRCIYEGENADFLTDGRLSFSLTATPREHLQMLVNNLNFVDDDETPWKIGEYPKSISIDENDIESESGTEKTIAYDYTTLQEAIATMADTFNVEWNIDVNEKTVNLAKLEKNNDNPLSMSYGKGRGFKSGVGRTNERNLPPIQRLYVQGGERNIDPSKYGKDVRMSADPEHIGEEIYSGIGSRTLLLPLGGKIWYNGREFWGANNEHDDDAVLYVVSSDRRSITRAENANKKGLAEGAFDCSEVYPRRIGKVSKVAANNAKKNLWDIYDNEDDFPTNFATSGIGGEKPTIVFQNGNLAGREFDINSTDTRVVTEQTEDGWRIEIVPAEIDGVWMPGGNTPDDANDDYAGDSTWLPSVGNEYIVFGILLPDEYIRSAETELFYEAVKYLYEQEKETYNFSGEVDAIWAKKNWEEIKEYMDIGQHIMFSDDFMPDGILLRVTGIKQMINSPHSPQLTLSNALVQTSLGELLSSSQYKNVVKRSAKQTESIFQQNNRANRRVGSLENQTTDLRAVLLTKNTSINTNIELLAEFLQKVSDRVTINERRFAALDIAVTRFNIDNRDNIEALDYENCLQPESNDSERIKQIIDTCPAGKEYELKLTQND